MRGMAVATRPAVRVQRSVRARGASASASVYTVQRNDNLWNIANKYGVSLDDLKRVNSTTLGGNYDVIFPGTQLVIPGAMRKSSPIPSFARPASSSSYSNYSASVAPAAKPAVRSSSKTGIGLVTAGAFFIALAVGIMVFKDDDGAQDDADGRYDDQGNWIPTGYEGQGYYDPAGNWVWVQEQQSQGWGQVSQGYADEQQGWGQDPQQQQGGGQWNQRY
jgi:LysM repeat protein|tara:strand:- start:1787 stop:2443 length:657 start_codon:yes stop_codon:yes gene_type:complete